MLRKAISHPRETLALLAHDPVEIWHKVRDRVAQHTNRAAAAMTYIPDPQWEARLHQLLNAPSSGEESEAFWELWPKIMDRLRDQGVDPGPLRRGQSSAPSATSVQRIVECGWSRPALRTE